MADSLSVFSKSMPERLLRPEGFFTAAHPQAIDVSSFADLFRDLTTRATLKFSAL